MTSISVVHSLSAFRRETEKAFDFGAFTVTLKRFTLADPKIKARVEAMQRKQRRLPAGVSTGLATEVEVFCEMALVDWTLKDDNGKAVPIDKALEVLTGSTEGQELYYNLLQLATSADAFDQIDETAVDKAELKN